VDAGIRGSAEILFPANDLGAPDWRDAAVVARTWGQLAELPPPQARLVKAMYVGIELAAPLLAPGLRRSSRMSLGRRTRLVRRLRRSRIYPLRFLADSLKSFGTMMYMSAPCTLAYIGHFKVDDRPGDPFRVAVRSDYLGSLDLGPTAPAATATAAPGASRNGEPT
jgi:hypothetical protein